MKQCNYSREALFQLNGIPPLGMSISLALQHLVAMIVGCVTPAIIIANALGLPQSERASAHSGILGHVRSDDPDRVIPHWRQAGFRTSCNVRHQLCLLAQYAGHRWRRRRHCHHCGCNGRWRYRCRCCGCFCEEDPQIFPAHHHRHGGVHDRPFSLSHRHQLYGRRYREYLRGSRCCERA